jgi:hypothetical protein
MAATSFAETEKSLELRLKALEANQEELPHMEVPRQRGAAILTEMKELGVKQASLTADKQEVSKRLATLNGEAKVLMTSMDSGLRAQYGTRSEKLVVPVVELPIPLVEEPLPVGKLGIPVGEEPLPVAERSIPLVEEPLPVVELPIPVVAEPLPIAQSGAITVRTTRSCRKWTTHQSAVSRAFG